MFCFSSKLLESHLHTILEMFLKSVSKYYNAEIRICETEIALI